MTKQKRTKKEEQVVEEKTTLHGKGMCQTKKNVFIWSPVLEISILGAHSSSGNLVALSISSCQWCESSLL